MTTHGTRYGIRATNASVHHMRNASVRYTRNRGQFVTHDRAAWFDALSPAALGIGFFMVIVATFGPSMIATLDTLSKAFG